MAWYFRLSGDPGAVQLLKARYAVIEKHFDDAGPGGFSPQPPGTRSHNPYMHLLEAMLAAFHGTGDEFWLVQARRIELLFRSRLFDSDRGIVFEYLNPDWSVAGEGRVEIGHQFEWATLLLELHEITGDADLVSIADRLFGFSIRWGFEDGLAIDAVDGDGAAMDRRKLFWSQLEAARHFSVRSRLRGDGISGEGATEQWRLIDQRFIHANGWTWYNSIAADGTPVEEPPLARLLYHVVSARVEL